MTNDDKNAASSEKKNVKNTRNRPLCSLSVQRLQSHPSNMGAKALKGRYRNAFKNATEEEIEKLIKNAYSLIRYGVYSTVTSSTLSGWY